MIRGSCPLRLLVGFCERPKKKPYGALGEGVMAAPALKKEAGHDGGVKEGDFVVLVPESGGGTPCIVKVTKQG